MYIRQTSKHDLGKWSDLVLCFLALKVASDQNLPWQQALKKKKDP